MPFSPEIRIVNNAEDLFHAAAAEFTDLANNAIGERGRFTVALSGGSTPKGLYSLLATGAYSVPWEYVYCFWGDERHVPPDDPENNYKMANEAMLSKLPIPPKNIFRIVSEEKDAQVAAEKYEQTLIEFFGLRPGEFPRFDLVLLGIGPDGHTASLFPDSPKLHEKEHLVVANWVEKFQTDRITLTLPVLNRAATVIFLVSGEEKAGIVQQILEGPGGRFPSQLVRPEGGELIWLMDRGAAGGLSSKP